MWESKRRALGPAIQALIPQAFQYDFGQLMERLTYPGRSASEVGARAPREADTAWDCSVSPHAASGFFP